MSFRTTKTATVSTPVPDNIKTEDVVAKIHDHVFIIEASPFSQGSEKAACPDDLAKTAQQLDATCADPPTPDAAWIAYLVYERIPLYGTISFHVALKNYPAGHNQVVHAPQGLVMKGQSRVVVRDGQRFYEDSCEFSVNRLLMPFVLRNWEKAHHDLHLQVLSILQSGSTDLQSQKSQTSSRPTTSQRPSWVKRLSSFSSAGQKATV